MAVVPPSIAGSVSSGRTGVSGVGFVTLTVPHTVTTSDVLVVFVLNRTVANEPPEVDWNGTPMELLHGNFSLGIRSFVYQLFNPSPGPGDVTVFHNHAFGTDIAAAALQVANFGGFRWAEPTWTFSIDPDPLTQVTRIYADATDLVLSFFGWFGNGATVTADAGQTVLSTQSGAAGEASALAVGRVTAPVAVGLPPVAANDTQTTWTVSAVPFNSAINCYLLAIKGLDRAAPAGAPSSIGRVTDSMTLEQQPPLASIPVADNPWRWRHEIPPTHRTLVVLLTYFDSAVSSVIYTPDGSAALPLTALANPVGGSASVWILENAPASLGYLRAITNMRWCGASAYSIAGTGVVGDTRQGGEPFMEIPTASGRIVVDRIANQLSTFHQWTPGSGGTGQAIQYSQPIYGAANVRSATTGSNSGAGSWTTATAATTVMDWTVSPVTTFFQCGFAFAPAAPPEIVEEVIPIRRLRRAPVLHHEDEWIFHKAFQLDLKTGIGLDGVSTTLGHDPQVMLRWSNNGGRTWSNEHWVSAGKIGQYTRRARWRRLGRARNRVYEVVVSDPNAWNLLAAYLDVEGEG